MHPARQWAAGALGHGPCGEDCECRFIQSPAHRTCGDSSSVFVLAQFRHETLLYNEPRGQNDPQELVKKAQELLTFLQCSEELLGSVGLTEERSILDGRIDLALTVENCDTAEWRAAGLLSTQPSLAHSRRQPNSTNT